MSTSNDSVEVARQRQRSFSMRMSLALFAYYLLDVNLVPQTGITIGGISLNVGRSGNFVFLLWAVWVWAFWRYGQRVFGLWPSQILGEIRLAAESRFQKRILMRGTREAKRNATENHLVIVGGSVEIKPPENMGSQSDYFPQDDGARLYAFKYKATRRNAINLRDRTVSFTARKGYVCWLRFRSHVSAAVGLPPVGEHLVPLLVGVAVFCFGVWSL